MSVLFLSVFFSVGLPLNPENRVHILYIYIKHGVPTPKDEPRAPCPGRFLRQAAGLPTTCGSALLTLVGAALKAEGAVVCDSGCRLN